MQLYDKTVLEARLPSKPYCSNDLSFGVRILPKEKAVEYSYIQFNDNYLKFMVFDLDHEIPFMWEQADVAPPNFITRNKDNGKCHYWYVLESPIYKDYTNKARNLAYYAKIQQAYTKILKADSSYVGLVAKNPLSDHWQTHQPNYWYPYTLDELADYVDLPERITKREAVGEGRNCYLFDAVRKWAYREVLFYKQNQATLEDFQTLLLDRLDKLNVFEKSLPLSYNEIKVIAKSIAKWTWRNFSQEKFSAIQSARRNKSEVVKKKLELREKLKNEFSTAKQNTI